jgi:NAD-dependent dihydropyrimidine dehydrogenase PreA subunit
MMQVDLEKCAGCGECLQACPVEAIWMVAGRAVIDPETCLDCGVCVEACPEGAISEVWSVLEQSSSLQAVPATKPPMVSENRLAWAVPLFSYIGREIVPRLTDTVVVAIERRLSTPSEARFTSGSIETSQTSRGQRQERRRRRGRKF